MEEIEEIRKIQHKLYEESSELADKMAKLDEVLNSPRNYDEITGHQLNLLNIQLQSMKTYFRVLRVRIVDLQDEITRLENKGE